MAIHRVGRSRLGAPYRSRLGVLTRPSEQVMAIGLFDRGYRLSWEATWNNNLVEWNEILAKYGPFPWDMILIDFPPGTPQGVPDTRPDDTDNFGTPDGISVFDITNRPVTLQDFVNAYTTTTAGKQKPTHVVILTDGSSATYNHFPPAFGDPEVLTPNPPWDLTLPVRTEIHDWLHSKRIYTRDDSFYRYVTTPLWLTMIRSVMQNWHEDEDFRVGGQGGWLPWER